MSKPAIIVHDIAKAYRLGALGLKDAQNATFRDALAGMFTSPLRRLRSRMVEAGAEDDDNTFWALRGVNFEVEPGEVIGILGRNGAGKSTLLKILSRVVEPTRGFARMRGRVASLLEVGTGFHPELTGRENIYLNGAILGMKRTEIKAKFDDIVEFAEVEKFLETPVKRYSSGMYVRLAFAVAAHLDPEILIVDEVLAVGDQQFQKKCLGKMQEVASGSGRTVLFVSHNMNAVRRLCSRCVYLKDGVVEMNGPTNDVVDHYIHTSTPQLQETPVRDRVRGSGHVMTFTGLRCIPLASPSIVPGAKVRFEIDYESEQTLRNASIAVSIDTEQGDRVIAFNTRLELGMQTFPAGKHTVSCTVDDFPLAPGTYGADLYLWSNNRPVDHVEKAAMFEVRWADYFGTGELPSPNGGRIVKRSTWESPAFDLVAT